MKKKCWFHGKDPCPDRARCVRNGNVDPPERSRFVGLHRPNRFGSWAEEAHARRNPGVAWDGIVADLATPEVRRAWPTWGEKNGRSGPVVKTGDKKELERLCKVAGVRMMEPGEILPLPKSPKERMAARGRRLSQYV